VNGEVHEEVEWPGLRCGCAVHRHAGCCGVVDKKASNAIVAAFGVFTVALAARSGRSRREKLSW
jgi:hypothetical protein